MSRKNSDRFNDRSHNNQYTPVRVPSPWCVCKHLSEDHEPECVGIGFDCMCKAFTPDEEDDEGYWFTDDEGRKLEGRA